MIAIIQDSDFSNVPTRVLSCGVTRWRALYPNLNINTIETVTATQMKTLMETPWKLKGDEIDGMINALETNLEVTPHGYLETIGDNQQDPKAAERLAVNEILEHN